MARLLKTTPPSIFALLFLLIVFSLAACEEEEKNQSLDLSENVELTWILEDSVVLHSSVSDTLRAPWPYRFGNKFYLLDFFASKGYGFDSEGEIEQVFGNGPGEGPGEFRRLAAMCQIDTMIGIVDPGAMGVWIYTPQGVAQGLLSLQTAIGEDTFYYVNSDLRKFQSYRNRMYNFAEPGAINHDKQAYYDLPFLAIHDLQGALQRVVGKRAAIYHERLLTYAYLVDIDIDPFRNLLLVSQQASEQWDAYDLDGNFLYSRGIAGKAIQDQDFPSYQFEGASMSSQQANKSLIDLIFQQPEYRFVFALPNGMVMRSYRRGVEEYELLNNFLDKPHYLQIYDKDGNLVSDEPAPDPYFIPIGREGNAIWVSLERSQHLDAYSYTLYKYRADIKER